MGNYIYYCEILDEYTWEFPKGIIMIPWRGDYFTKISRCASYSNRIWVQGPRGGVKIIKDTIGTNYGYVTKNEGLMKEFMWAKLQARSLQGYT